MSIKYSNYPKILACGAKDLWIIKGYSSNQSNLRIIEQLSNYILWINSWNKL